MSSRNGRNGRSGTHSKLDRHNLEDFRPHTEEDEPGERTDEMPAGVGEQSDHPAEPSVAERSDVAEKTQTTAIADHTDESLEDKLERRSAADAYQALGDFLENFSADTVMITFPALENMLKRKLPASAGARIMVDQPTARAWPCKGLARCGVVGRKGGPEQGTGNLHPSFALGTTTTRHPAGSPSRAPSLCCHHRVSF